MNSRSEDVESLRVGDRIRFSTELLRYIHESSDHRSVICDVERIERMSDGTVIVYVGRTCEPGPRADLFSVLDTKGTGD